MRTGPGVKILWILFIVLLFILPSYAFDPMKSKHTIVYTSDDFEREAADHDAMNEYDLAWRNYQKAAEKLREEYDGKIPDEHYYINMVYYSDQIAENAHNSNWQDFGGENDELQRVSQYWDHVAAQTRQEQAEFKAKKSTTLSDFGCLIVTATFGSPMAGEVQLVRDFRDDTVKQNYLGSRYVTALNAMYYSFSPVVARTIDENPSVKPVMRVILAPLISIVLLSQGVYSLLGFSPGIATVVFIIIGGALVGLVYILPVMLPTLWIAARRKWHVPAVESLIPALFLWAGLLAVLVVGAVLQIDLIAVLSSGLLFTCTVFLTATAVALYLFRYLEIQPVGSE